MNNCSERLKRASLDLAWERSERGRIEGELAEARAELTRLRQRLGFVERALEARRQQSTVFVFQH